MNSWKVVWQKDGQKVSYGRNDLGRWYSVWDLNDEWNQQLCEDLENQRKHTQNINTDLKVAYTNYNYKNSYIYEMQ